MVSMTHNPSSQPLAVSISDAARLLSVSRRHLYDLLASGQLRAFKSGRRTLIRMRTLESYVAKREREAA
jgi:excisionase family DNA binding protein